MKKVCSRVSFFPSLFVPVLSCNYSNHEAFEVKEHDESTEEDDEGSRHYKVISQVRSS
jgi:hypothetical protein